MNEQTFIHFAKVDNMRAVLIRFWRWEIHVLLFSTARGNP